MGSVRRQHRCGGITTAVTNITTNITDYMEQFFFWSKNTPFVSSVKWTAIFLTHGIVADCNVVTMWVWEAYIV